jgi:N-acetylmuramoyl-L-alanine amidase
VIFLDVGHGHGGDQGARHGSLAEREVCERLCDEVHRQATAAGLAVTLVPSTWRYPHRHTWVRAQERQGRHLYVQLHANAGGGRYGLALHDARSSGGAAAAQVLAAALDDLPEITGSRTGTVQPGDGDGFDRGLICIDGIWSARWTCAVLLEVGFLDQPDHAELLGARMPVQAAAIVEGLRRWEAGLTSRGH